MWTKAVMTKLGLSLNEAKTSIRDARKERFEFLGYSFGPHYWWKNGQRYRRELYSKPPQPTSLPGHNTRSPSLLRICANHRSSGRRLVLDRSVVSVRCRDAFRRGTMTLVPISINGGSSNPSGNARIGPDRACGSPK